MCIRDRSSPQHGQPLPVGCRRGCYIPATLHVALLHQFATACHLNFKLSYLFTQSIAVYPQQVRTFSLVPAGGIECDLDERGLDFAQHTLIQPRWRKLPAVQIEIPLQVFFDRGRQLLRIWPVALERDSRNRAEHRLDLRQSDFLGLTGRHKAAHNVFKLAHVSRPVVTAH